MTQWEKAALDCNTALKELGDFENYFQVLNEEAEEIAGLVQKLIEKRMQEKEKSSALHHWETAGNPVPKSQPLSPYPANLGVSLEREWALFSQMT